MNDTIDITVYRIIGAGGFFSFQIPIKTSPEPNRRKIPEKIRRPSPAQRKRYPKQRGESLNTSFGTNTGDPFRLRAKVSESGIRA